MMLYFLIFNLLYSASSDANIMKNDTSCNSEEYKLIEEKPLNKEDQLKQKVSIPRQVQKKQKIKIKKNQKNNQFSKQNTISLDKKARFLLSNLSLEEKLGQMLMLSFSGTNEKNASYLIDKLNAGGFILFSYNIKRTKNAKFDLKMTLGKIRKKSLQNLSIPPFVSIDQEGGKILRLRSVGTAVPSFMSLGATRSQKLSYLIGKLVGVELETLGINFNLAPVLDTNKNPKNSIIGVRAFGDDYSLVSALGTAYIKGLQSRRVLATAKHFPGHGATLADSHYETPVLNKTAFELMKTDWLPFRNAIGKDVSAVMIGHIAVPKIDSTISTFSHTIITKYLKSYLGFDGIVITDDMMMTPVSTNRITASIKAINAGADVLILSGNTNSKQSIYKGLLKAIKKGSIKLSRVNDATLRIIKTKLKRGLFKAPESFDKLRLVGSKAHYQLVKIVAKKSLTLVKGENFMHNIDEEYILLSQFKSFKYFLDKYGVKSEFTHFPLSYSFKIVDTILKKLKENPNKTLLVTILNEWNLDIIRLIKAKKHDAKILAISLDSPYYYKYVGAFVDAFVCSYSYRPVSLQALAKFVSGKVHIASGTLPVELFINPYDRIYGLN